MSPVSRGRKPKKNSKRTTGRKGSRTAPSFPYDAMLDDIMPSVAALPDDLDPIDVEMLGATIVDSFDIDQKSNQILARELVPVIEQRGNEGALALLIATATVADGPFGHAVERAAERLRQGGVSEPAWAAELRQPVTATDYPMMRIAEPNGLASVLRCGFERAGRRHEFLVEVNNLDCGAATGVGVIDAAALGESADEVAAMENDDVAIIEQLEPSDLR